MEDSKITKTDTRSRYPITHSFKSDLNEQYGECRMKVPTSDAELASRDSCPAPHDQCPRTGFRDMDFNMKKTAAIEDLLQ